MIIGVPREVKDGEFRVGITPDVVRELVSDGHRVLVQQDAGAAAGFTDHDYRAAGAAIASAAAEVYTASLIVKVKEIYPQEYALLRPGQITFCFQHFAPAPKLLQACLDARVTAIAFETVGQSSGLPLLRPMSEIAGRLSIQMAMWALQTSNGGSGVLLQGTPSVAPGKVVIIGAGASGSSATHVAASLGCRTVVFARTRRRLDALEALNATCEYKLTTHVYDAAALTHEIADADVLIGAVLNPGQTSPTLLSRAMHAQHAPWLSVRRHWHRPKRHRRDLAPDFTLSAAVYRRRRGALLCTQHARRRRTHCHPRPWRRHPALRESLVYQGFPSIYRDRCGAA